MLSCEIDVSDVFNWNYNSKADIVVNQGGTSSGKTYSILQVLFFIACTQENKIISSGITPQLLQQQFIERWDGKTPIYGNMPVTLFKSTQ